MAFTYVNHKTGQVLVTTRRVQGGFWVDETPKKDITEEDTAEEDTAEEETPEEPAPKKTTSRRGKK